jgi:hypothetical protein
VRRTRLTDFEPLKQDHARLEAAITQIRAWCEEKPDQWVMRSDFLDVLDAYLAASLHTKPW